MRDLHAHGVKGYVTLNTLVFDDELPAVERAVRACAAAGVDAVIVQDFGVARVVRAIAPEMPIHASTQMTCTDTASVELALELGAKRVVLARELSTDDIARIASETDVELEVFVHGALCIAYSGQCLTSEAIGGRSANRGACAQACRLPYRLVVDGELRDEGDSAYLLSPEDLEATSLVGRLAELGVRSFKIEGRLKGPEYVYATTRLYREAIAAAFGDGAAPTDAQRRGALQTYTRGSGHGFLDGVDHQRLVDGETCDHRGLEVGETHGVRVVAGKQCVVMKAAEPIARGDGLLVRGGFADEGEVGGRAWEILDGRGHALDAARAGDEVLVWLGPDAAVGNVRAGRRVFRTSDPANERALRHAIEQQPFATPLALRVHGAMGERPTFEAWSVRDGRRATVEGESPIERARGQATTREVLEDKLGGLGDTPFALASLEVDLPADSFLPLASLKRARRALVAAIDAQAARAHRATDRHVDALLAEAVPPDRAPPPAGVFVLCRTLEQAEAALDSGATGVGLDFLELTGTGDALRTLRERGVHVIVAPLCV
jgi:putative protease